MFAPYRRRSYHRAGIMARGSTAIRWMRLITTLALVVTVGGCYVPVRYDAEIEISRTGFYRMIFDGYVARLPLYTALVKDELSPAEEREKVAQIQADLRRDSSVRQADYIRDGLFKVNWDKAGDIFGARMVTFIRRNEAILTLKYVKDTGLVTMRGADVSRDNALRLIDAGLNITGELRVITDAKVVRHNAAEVRERDDQRQMYIWTQRSALDAAPELEISVR